MKPFNWIANTLRNRIRNTLLGNLMRQQLGTTQPKILRVVSATRLTDTQFWSNSALGKSLKIWLSDPTISADIAFENTQGLPTIYNAHLRDPKGADALVFVHDDVWLDDPQWPQKVRLALSRYDLVGVAGNTRLLRDQPIWASKQVRDGGFLWDQPFLSGYIGHGQKSKGEVSYFGPTPATCEVLDGVFIALRVPFVRAAGIALDERFKFHFYDLDFCRTARRAGLSLGTWPIELTHQSGGSFLRNPEWRAGRIEYFSKWNGSN